VASETQSISVAVRRFADSLPPDKHLDSQEALRFARWFGEERPALDIRPSDIESYVDSFGATAPNAGARADALKRFLAYAHKQGILPERFVSHVRVRRAGGRSRVSNGTLTPATTTVQLTAAGKQALESELEELRAKRPKIAADLRDARADGDMRENAPLDAAREAQGQLEARIRELENMLRYAVITNEEGGAEPVTGTCRIGSNVVISNVATGAQLSYQLVNPAEARAGTGRLSAESPVGQALIGHRAGDEVEVTAPSGMIRFRIETINQ
jgi:transcription elongation factor GreA